MKNQRLVEALEVLEIRRIKASYSAHSLASYSAHSSAYSSVYGSSWSAHGLASYSAHSSASWSARLNKQKVLEIIKGKLK